MAYIPLSDITLQTNFTAKGITIENYNMTVSRIKGYLEHINTGITTISNLSVPIVYGTAPTSNVVGAILIQIDT